VYVLLPAHAGSGETTGAETVNVLPQLSNTTGVTGAVAFDAQATVELPFAGIETTGALIVYVYTHE
jgi:hypothetical protein